MADLPFLVVHGAIVWKLLVVVFAVGAYAAGRAVQGVLARRAARYAADMRLDAASAVAVGHVRLRGKLRGGTIWKLSRSFQTFHHVDGAPWLDCPSARVELDAADASLDAGTHVETTMLGVPRATPAALRKDAKGGAWTLTRVGDGDEVSVAGVASRLAKGDAGYRDDATVWRLGPGRTDVVAIAAVTPVARAAPTHAIVAVLWLGLFGGIGYGALHAIGSHASDHLTDQCCDHRATATSIAPFGDFAIAAAMPGSRASAIDHEIGELDGVFEHRASLWPLTDAITDLDSDDPCDTAHRQLSAVRLDDALASARRCGDRELEAAVQLFRGDYAAAHALAPKDLKVRAIAAIGAGDWATAAAALDEHADEPGKWSDAELGALRDREEHCLAALLRAYGGDPAPAAKLAGNADFRCRLVAALAMAPDSQLAALRALAAANEDQPIETRDYADMEHVRAVRAALGDFDDRDRAGNLGFEVRPDDWIFALASDDTRRAHPRLRIAHAGTSMIAGNPTAAGDDLQALLAAAGSADTDLRTDADTVANYLALRTGGDLPASADYTHPGLTEQVALRRGELSIGDAAQGVHPTGCGDDLRAGIGHALRGDGGPLATVFADCDVFYIYVPRLLFGILPHVRDHRAELADTLRTFRSDISTFAATNVPFQILDDLADYRDVAHLAGDDQEAANLQDVIARHVAVARDLKRAIAFALVSD